MQKNKALLIVFWESGPEIRKHGITPQEKFPVFSSFSLSSRKLPVMWYGRSPGSDHPGRLPVNLTVAYLAGTILVLTVAGTAPALNRFPF
jgi:hypothetical protein